MLTKEGITFSKIILAVGRCDLRKGIDGLATVVRLKYGLDPLEKDTILCSFSAVPDVTGSKACCGPVTGMSSFISGLQTEISNGPGLLMKPGASMVKSS